MILCGWIHVGHWAGTMIGGKEGAAGLCLRTANLAVSFGVVTAGSFHRTPAKLSFTKLVLSKFLQDYSAERRWSDDCSVSLVIFEISPSVKHTLHAETHPARPTIAPRLEE
jgi:hypothetical protein